MTFEEMLGEMSFEYHATLAATCQDGQASNLIDQDKAKNFPAFYDFLLTRGFNRHQLSAHGIGRGVEA